MPHVLIVMGVSCAAAVLMIMITPVVLRKLPAPHGEKPDLYRGLAGWRFYALVALAITAATAVSCAATAEHCYLWIGLNTLGSLAICIDAKTKYLPRKLAQISWILISISSVINCVQTGTMSPVLRAALATIIVGGLAMLMHRYASLGFGDVRLLASIAATTAAMSWSLLYLSLVAGALLGAVVAVITVAARRVGTFAYGPALWGGAYCALIYQLVS